MGKHRSEPAHVLAAYALYESQPTPRSLKKLAATLSKPYRTVAQWAQWYGWRTRALNHDAALIDAAAADAAEERATHAIVRNFHSALKLTMGDYATSVQRRHEKGEPVRENEVLVALKCLGILYKDYADILIAEPAA